MRELSEYITEYVSSGRGGAKLLMDIENMTTLDELVKFLDTLGYEHIDMCEISEMLNSQNGNVYCFNKKYRTLPMCVLVRVETTKGDVVCKFELDSGEKILWDCYKMTQTPSGNGYKQEHVPIKLALKMIYDYARH